MISINTNVTQMVLGRLLNASAASYSQAEIRLSTGLKINTPADNPSVWYTSQNIKGDIQANEQALQNIQLGSNVTSSTTSVLEDIADNLDSIKSLVNSVTPETTIEQRSEIQTRIDEYTENIVNLINTSKVEDLYLISAKALDDTSATQVRFQIGTDSSEYSRLYLNTSLQILNTTDEGGNPSIYFDVSTDEAVTQSLADLEEIQKNITSKTSYEGTMSGIFTSLQSQTETKITNLESAYETYTAADTTAETERMTEEQIRQQTIAALMVQNQTLEANIVLQLVGYSS